MICLRGRVFTNEELDTILQVVSEYEDRGRTRISEEVCRALDWRQPNGWLKDRACRDVLVKMEQLGIVKLPPKRANGARVRCAVPRPLVRLDLYPVITSPVGELELCLAKGNKAEREWNEIVQQCHYLGHHVVVGRCLKYLVRLNGNLVAALSFSSASWSVGARDRTLSRLGVERAALRDRVLNNSRFLILPNVVVPHLASRILSRAAERVKRDWREYYSVDPLCLETFVQPSMYAGTCYFAANWVCVGRTAGYRKSGTAHANSQEPKMILLYGLTKPLRRRLTALRGLGGCDGSGDR